MNGVYQLSTGKELAFKYDYVWYFIEGLAKVRLKGKYGYIGKTGKEVVPCKYDYVWDFIEGLARVQLNGKYGFVDKTGREVIPCIYDSASEFSEGFALVKLNRKYGYIDTTGRKVIPLKYDDAYGLDKGLATVKLNGKWGMTNCLGIEVVSLISNNIWRFNFAAIVKLGNKYGLVNNNVDYILPCQYDEINVFDGRIIAEKSDINYEFNPFGELINILTDTEANCLYYDFGRRPFV